MKNYLFGGILILAFLTACQDADLPKVNGMWQLKTIQEKDHTTQAVDTVYFSFQRQAIFSYTLLNGDTSKPNSTVIIYGYVDFPAENKMHIQLDKNNLNGYHTSRVLWKGEQVTYDILKLNSKELILGQEGTRYHFIKF
ncbi:MAG: lipocalin-like domain-containing protein [Candidatus Symbiothrix sp.]|jgi:hypothetical protein|nr:lipocalin-like domain-containing protein [Candidatus Symbiothrix sp.]